MGPTEHYRPNALVGSAYEGGKPFRTVKRIAALCTGTAILAAVKRCSSTNSGGCVQLIVRMNTGRAVVAMALSFGYLRMLRVAHIEANVHMRILVAKVASQHQML